MNDLLVALRSRIQGAPSDEVLIGCLEDAEAICLGWMGRTEMPEGCKNAVVRMALSLYNRLGIEGQSSHSEGGVSLNVDPIPLEVKTALRPFRRAVTGGY